MAERSSDLAGRGDLMQAPLNPLPAEIQQMERSETVCQYCGVSYLILHEFHRLQQRLEEAERLLTEQRASGERESRLRAQLQESRSHLEELAAAQQQRQERLQGLDVQLERERAHGHTLRQRCESQQKALESIVCVLRSSQHELQAIRSLLCHFKAFWENWRGQILQRSKEADTERVELQQQVMATQVDARRSQEEMLQLRGRLSSAELQVGRLLEQNDKQRALVCHARHTESELRRLKEEVENLDLHLQKSRSERVHAEDHLEMKTRETEELRSRLTECEAGWRETLLRVSHDLREKEESWLSCQQRCDTLQEQLLAWQQKGVEMTGRVTQAEVESATLRDALQQAREQAAALEDERHKMNVNHRSAVEGLEEGFRKKLEDTEDEKTQLQATLERQKDQFKEQGLQLKREVALELNIERQKNQQLISKYQRDYQQLQNKVPAMLQQATQELKAELSSLAEQLMEAQARSVQLEQQKDAEVQRLQEEALQLERQLLQERSAAQVKAKQLHQQRAPQLEQVQRELEQLRLNSTALQEENCLLQETVRRECAEREELTAALTLAREQLLERRRPSLSPPHARPSPNAATSRPGWAAGGQTTASWHGQTPTLPRLNRDRHASDNEGRQRISLLMSRKERQ
ncbi:leucine-, glutamate- and lysine-rich protein 1 isoform X2 [Denticeps clupeoides]|uniref:Leucine-, glutamate- and lysine-rich protein 1 n=1 Tax=Denticeps clupeoides TaxID=299321 RepID=A0AAY4DH04_9TELE|nr:leucine-, glutamate- and lysine-rich protein 1 isoform X2 [Denticeps clupeoides]